MVRGNTKTFRFQYVSEEDVKRKIKELDDKPSSGLDEISYGVIKRMKDTIAEPITEMINKSIWLCYHPKPERRGAVNPLYKGGEKLKTDPKAYRPVNLLPAIGRIQEALLGDQMNEFSEDAELLPPGLHGYRKHLGTTTALLEMQESVHQEVERGNIVAVAFLDISAGFDTVPHTYMLRKMEMIGYEPSAIRWMSSYLENRTQVIKVETAYSEEDTIIKGVPQGGPMSPIIFRDYTMDIIMSIFDSQDWRDGEKEDNERIEKHRAEGTPMGIWGGEVSERSLNKDSKDKEDKWDLRIAFEKKYEMFTKEEKLGIGPERRQVEKYEGSSRATLYADDSSAREAAKTLRELKEKTERMLIKLFDIMRKNRLAVNTDSMSENSPKETMDEGEQ